MSLRGTVSTGMETTSNVPDVYKLTLLDESAARFTRVLSEVKKSIRRLKAAEYKTQERRPRGAYTQINFAAGYAAGDTELIVDDSTIFSIGDTFYLPRSGEQFRITGIVYSTHTLTVTRAVQSTGSAAAITDNDYVLRIARNENEAYSVGASYMTDTVQTTNYAETISTPVEWSNLQMETASYLSPSQQDSRIKPDIKAMAIEHLKEIERALIFHKKAAITDSNSKRLLLTNGIIPSISTYVYDHSGGSQITEALYNSSFVEKAWRKSPSQKKWAPTSNKVLTVLEGFGRANLQHLSNESQTLGFDVVGYRTTRGMLRIFHHPLLDELPYYFDESQLLLDMQYIRLAILKDTNYRENIQNKKDNVRLDEWQTILGLDMEYEEAHVFGRDFVTAT